MGVQFYCYTKKLCISLECFHNLTIPIYFPVCKEPEIPQNGSLLYSEDRLSVTYSCDVGFSASGTTDQTCQPEGPGWTDTPPACGIYNLLGGGEVDHQTPNQEVLGMIPTSGLSKTH